MGLGSNTEGTFFLRVAKNRNTQTHRERDLSKDFNVMKVSHEDMT